MSAEQWTASEQNWETVATLFHSGGMVRRYHGRGSSLGNLRLGPGEVPGILEEGEVVIPRNDVATLRRLFESQNVRRYHEGGLVTGPAQLLPFGMPSGTGSDGPRLNGAGAATITQHVTMPLTLHVSSIDPTSAADQVLRQESVILNMVAQNLRRGGMLARLTGQR